MRQISIVPLVIAFLVPLGNDMIDRSLAWAYGDQAEIELGNMKSFIDVGCGVGARGDVLH